MNSKRIIRASLVIIFLSVLIVSLFSGCSNTTDTSETFGDLAVLGEEAYNLNCTPCHGNSFSTGPYAVQTLSSYANARYLLDKINSMSAGTSEIKLQVLCYFLVEHGWVSAKTVFDVDKLPDISLPRK